MDILEVAKWYVSQGLSVIPVKADGSKSPLITGWRKYTNTQPTPEELTAWFGGGNPVGIGIVPGPASGNLVVLDFENHGESAYFEWIQRLPEELRTLAQSLPTVATPSGSTSLSDQTA
jgi:putative DNA primase/helicase